MLRRDRQIRTQIQQLADACLFAVHAAAMSVTRMGCQASVPSRMELDAFLRRT